MRRGRPLRISALFCADQSRKPTPAVLVRLTGRRHCIFSGVTFFGPTDRATAARQGFAVITIRTNKYTDPCWRPSSLLCCLPQRHILQVSGTPLRRTSRVSRDVLWYIPQGASADTIFFQWSQCTGSYVLPDGGASRRDSRRPRPGRAVGVSGPSLKVPVCPSGLVCTRCSLADGHPFMGWVTTYRSPRELGIRRCMIWRILCRLLYVGVFLNSRP